MMSLRATSPYAVSDEPASHELGECAGMFLKRRGGR
jgi:hypothetical protein